MSLIISEEVLEKIQCSFCYNYLSCGPTKITDTGIACGRCSLQKQGVPSLFNTVAQLVLFPCMNRYSGCNKLLRYNDVEKHEKECIGEKFRCPAVSTCEGYFSYLSLINHYKQEHTKYILSEPKISLTIGTSSCGQYLYCDDMNNWLFLIYVNWDGKSVSCNVSLAGQKTKQVVQMVDKTNYKDYCTNYNDNSKVFKISHKELQHQGNTVLVEFILKRLHNPRLVLHYEQINNWPKMCIGEEFIKYFGAVDLHEFEYKPHSLMLVNTKGFFISIKCSFCKNYFWDVNWDFKIDISSCNRSDINACYVCPLCVNRGYRVCYHQRTLAPLNSSKLYNIFFYCRNNCGLYFKFNQLQKHEYKCFGISEEQDVKRKFGLLFPLRPDKSTHYIKGNIVECRNFPYKNATIYMSTYDGLKCILNVVYVNERQPYVTFEGSHDYDISKFCLLFRICEHGRVREQIHNFSIKLANRERTFFVVTIKEVVKTMLLIKN